MASVAPNCLRSLAVFEKDSCSPRTSRSSSLSTATPCLIHGLTYRRTRHKNSHVRGYKAEGRTTTPFDMGVPNDLDRCPLVLDVINVCRSWAHGGLPEAGAAE